MPDLLVADLFCLLCVDIVALYLAENSAEDNKMVDSKSNVAPFRVVNIGNSKPSQLLDFIKAIEKTIGIEANKNLMSMQPGDVPATWADATLLEELTGYKATTDVLTGVESFVSWYREYYNV